MRRVLVTGSSRGIGRAIAQRLARAGFTITFHCRSSRSQADALAAQLRASVLQFDVTDRAATRDALERDLQANGPYYGVVCNAGVARDNTFAALSDAEWDEVLNTSLDGFYNVVQPLVMPMVRAKQGGRIVTISSVSGIVGQRGQVNYSAAKAGLIGATKALAVELASRRITVNCVAPGLIETDMTANVPLEQALKMVPMNRIGTAEEVAAAVDFVMSDDAAYITRQVISVNGGLA
jgi:3-oxoacyl-[acyl-carrier protein] reductase